MLISQGIWLSLLRWNSITRKFDSQICAFFYFMRIFDFMKTRLNLTIENNLLTNMKLYAEKRHVSVSELVEDYFKSVTKPIKRKNIIDLIESLDKPNIDQNADLKELYYQDQRHGG